MRVPFATLVLLIDSMKVICTIPTKIYLSLASLGALLLLISSRGSIRNQKQRSTTLAGLLLLSWVGLTLYGYSYSVTSRPASALKAFYFVNHLLSGICVAMLIFVLWPQGVKTVLRISGILFIGFNIYAVAHYDLRHLAPAIRLFSMGNGLVIGMLIPSAIFLWLEEKANPGDQKGGGGIAVPEGTTPSVGPPKTGV
jgi:hypothetical protein